MKRILFILTLLNTLIMAQIEAQTTDLELIEKTIDLYFDGMVNHNAVSIEKAFHPTATMKWVDGEMGEVNAVEALSDFVNSNDPVKTKTSIVSANVSGNAANYQLELEYETFYFIDFMHLLKIDGVWKIVNKIYYKKQKSF